MTSNSLINKKTVAVAMSGGVDSSYALLKLKEMGYDVFGITLKLFCYGELEPSIKSCCSLDAIKDAKGICSSAGVHHMVINGEEIFKKEVIDYFINAYKAGLTPNPCVICNSSLKWNFLLQKALSFGADFIATGHYSRIEYCNENKRYLLKCGLDPGKDQSYYLWQLTQEQLKRTLFPLGDMTKEMVKKEMEKYDLRISEKQESQEICFIPDNDYRKFLKEMGNLEIGEGNIVDSSGNIMGTHKGYPFYTIGQRRGLGVASSGRIYVTSIDPLKNEVKLGQFEELYVSELTFSSANFIACSVPSEDVIFKARIRYRGKLSDCRIKSLSNGTFLLSFIEPVWGVCPGQSVVIYDGDKVLGGGIIK